MTRTAICHDQQTAGNLCAFAQTFTCRTGVDRQAATRQALVNATIYGMVPQTHHNPLLAGQVSLQNLRTCAYILVTMKLQKPTPGLEVCGPEGSPDYWGVISEMASVRVRCPTNSPQISSLSAFARCDGVLQREHRNQNHPLAFVSFFHLTLRRGVGLARETSSLPLRSLEVIRAAQPSEC